MHRQMRLAGISSARRRAYKATANSNHSHSIAPNLLMRNFTFPRPDQAWVGDITYIPTGEGWLYRAIVKDLCTRKIVGYAFSERIDTQLTLAALDMAYRRRMPLNGRIFHSDRGVQYASRSAAMCDVFAYLETFYNTLRPHSALGWVSPSRFEAELCISAV